FSQGLPLEGFESTGGPDLPFPTTPSEWTLGTSVPGNTWQVFDNGVGLQRRWDVINGAGNFYAGANATFIDRDNINQGNTSEDYLATPLVTIPVNGQLKFWTRTGSNGDQNTIYQIKVAPSTATQINPNAYSIVQQYSETTLHTTAPSTTPTNFDVYIQKTVDLSAFAGQSVYIAFVRQFTQPGAGLAGDRWYIDDVQVVQQCFNPTALTATGITFNSANLSWTSPGVTSWQIEVLPTAATPTGVGVSYSGALPYTATGLTSNTNYQYFVRSVCSPGNFSGWAGPFNFTTSVAPPICGGNYIDSGGITGNYTNNEDTTVTICPVTAGDVVTVTFNTFNTQATFDGLYVYSGNSVASGILIPSTNPAGSVPSGLAGSFWGTANPGSFTSFAANGCLTFRFRSNGTTVAAGWTSSITCALAPTCPQPIAVKATVPTATTATINWTETGTATQWQVLALPCTAPAPTASSTGFVTATTNVNFSLTGLNPDTCYNIYVRAVCSPTNLSAWSTQPPTVTTQQVPPACGGIFTDSGGANQSYANNEDTIVTICPINTGDAVTVTFNSFDTQANSDGLYVYSGNSIATGVLIPSTNPGGGVPGGLAGSFWGTTNPGSFTSSAANGCLTFRFRSNGSIVATGWSASVTCTLAPTCPQPIAVTTSNVQATTAVINWNSPATVTQWQVLALPCGSPAPTATSTGFVTATTNVNFLLTGLSSDTCYNIYVRAVCSPTDLSTWSSQPPTITTQIAPPACGGFLVDSGGQAGNYFNNEDQIATICPINTGDAVTVTFSAFNTQATFDGLYVFNGNSIAAPLIPSTNPGGGVPGGVAGSFWGTTNPGSFTSSAANGCLTFRFRSNGSTVSSGYLASVTCAPAPTCPQPYAVNAIANTSAISATINWTSPGPATQWQVLALPCGSPAPTASSTGFVNANTNVNFQLTGLTPETCYTIYVRAVCSPTDLSAWSSQSPSITTPVAPPACGGFFIDSGGSNGNYSNNEDNIVTVCPVNAGDAVTVTFIEFNTQATFDGLYVFDGNSIAATQLTSINPAGSVPGGLAGSFWGTSIPGPFVGEGPTGCLTFRFRSNATTVASGWKANVTCAPAPTCLRPTNVTATSITQTSASIAWTQVGTVNQWEILVLPAGSPLPTPTSTGFVTATTNPFVINNLNPGTQFQVYVRARCSTTNASSWSNPSTFATQISNDECANAIVVPVNSNPVCNVTTFGTITGATASTNPTAPCGGTPNDDVWFQFTATSPLHTINLLNVTGSTTNLYHAVYSGSCGSLVSVSCSDPDTSQLTNLVVGQTYYIRVYSQGNLPNQTANFTLCVATPSQCANAAPFCGSTGLSYPSTTGNQTGFGPLGCLGSSPNPAFFYLEVANTGPLNFQIAQTSTATGLGIDVDFIAYGPFTSQAASCNNLFANTAVACSYSAAAIENFTLANAVSGQIYVIMITNFNGSAGTVTFTQTNLGGSNAGTTNCAIVCSVNLGPDRVFCDAASYTITATNQSADTYQWFNGTNLIIGQTSSTLTVTQSGTYTCKIVCGLNNAEDSINVTFNTSTPSTFAPIATICQNAPAPMLPFTSTEGTPGTWMPATIDTNTVGTTNYVFTPNTGLCAQLGNVMVTITAPVTPQFTPIGPLCLNTPNVTLPTTSLNSVIGTWLPSVVTTNTAGTSNYVFTPDSGSCATGFTLTVTISDIPPVDTLPNITSCTSYVLPTLTNGSYFTGSNGTGTALAAGTTITSSQTIYIFASNPSNTNCTAQTSFDVTIKTITAQQVANAVACDSYVLPALTANNSYFTGMNGTGTQLNVGLSVTTSQTIYVYAQTGGTPNCTSETSFTVTINTTPTLGNFPDIVACTNYVLPIITTGNYFTDPNGTGTQLANGATLTTTTLVYVYANSSAGNCSTQKQFLVTINDNPSFTINGECQGTNFVLEAIPSTGTFNSTDYAFSWTDANGMVIGTNSTVIVNINGTYSLSVTSNISNCSTTESFAANQTSCAIQKGISPNGDSLNDSFDLSGYDIKKLSIYNRYGTKVYSKVNYTNQWFGQTDSGKELPDGTYYYVFEKNDGENKSGWIYINRQN
ncbi:MAG: gliding motility-associated-like protein, partial [Flavobacterium sp.]